MLKLDGGVYSPAATCPGFRNRVCGMANVASSALTSIAVAAIAKPV
jgi:hypothetical protein